ncbi:N-6 DNA methylase [Methanobrevibacter cuticularis]|uniref:site-specific DNA-methyltransferase (adenine-specific) n=1 Tax=Methanobrevibacter cuticularis TaxID=47311 RepID=A0A166CT52_9EURY|nr:N-6 DNA methylase [Methanobrevibacter cuticularis]KZX16627.1 N-6 DNA methylase [Methanobrevibacter cuticularis]
MEFKDKAIKIRELFKTETFEELPKKLMEIVLLSDKQVYDEYLEIVGDDTNFLQSIYQYYLAEREELKQDFTPSSLSKLCGVLTSHDEEKTVYDLCAGTGSLTLAKDTADKFFILHELNTETISSLLFNLSLKNVEGVVINGDVITGENKGFYKLFKGEKYSTVEKISEYEIPEYDSVISNPPFNLKSEHDIRFKDIIVKKKLINFGFLLKGLEKLTENGLMAFILPNGVLSSTHEKEYRKYLIGNGFLKAVITVPGSMFESTSIPTCILVLSKTKNTKVSFISINDCEDEITINKRGTGKACHENRVYTRKLGILSDNQIEDILNSINQNLDIAGFSKSVNYKEIINQDYNFAPGRFIDFVAEEDQTRTFEHIIDDINNIINDKNQFKLTLNLTIAKELKDWVELNEEKEKNNEFIDEINKELQRVNELKEDFEESNELMDNMNENMFYTDKRLINEKWLTITRSAKNEIKNTDPKKLSETFKENLSNCQMMIRYLNNKEIVLLAELRDKLLPLLMSGELMVPENAYVETEEKTIEVENTKKEPQKTLI